MDTREVIDAARRLADRHIVRDGAGFRLSEHDPDDVWPFGKDGKDTARDLLADGVRVLSEMQDMLYAQDRWSLLAVFQAMDAAGKDGAIKHVMSGVNPQGCEVHSFKAPSAEERDHDFMWRCTRLAPRRGMIGIFNRSYYEEVLVVRVRPEILRGQQLPRELVTDAIWEERFQDICKYERYLSRNGTVIRKFFLHVSKEEQRRRFLARIDDPSKNWKFSEGDVAERAHWDEYMRAYEDAIRKTSSEHAPWVVVPADNKWYTRLVVAAVMIDALASVDLHYPELDEAARARLAETRARLVAE
ncbi:MAG: polyphosphate kinase 2 family protein [Planctomycetaceae bacterium]|jgi:PPK2 family polyphosphate:nucleotide phosphotransferase|nr:polyphosphate kinase 2 family protein [Planctomycetaceae bacterium]